MAYTAVFKRHEIKYLLTPQQKAQMLRAMEPYMALDQYGRTIIRNLYYDTDSYLLIRRSMEKPVYKEKMRIRSYARANADSTVFVELKKKCKSVVYKRRIALPYREAMAWATGESDCPVHTQISDEIDYFLSYYEGLHPTVFLSYEREAYYAKDHSDFRVTFDDTILVRRDKLSLCEDPSGVPILPQDKVLMEIKCSGGIPLWMTEVLSHEHICKTSFSKYGTAYKALIFPSLRRVSPQSGKENISL